MTHRHEWVLGINYLDEIYIKCKHCDNWLEVEEAELRLNACEVLSAEMAREALNRLPDVIGQDEQEAQALNDYASILEGKDEQ